VKTPPLGLGKGRNNCFLNVVVQALWHLRPSREALLDRAPQQQQQQQQQANHSSTPSLPCSSCLDRGAGCGGVDDQSGALRADGEEKEERELCAALRQVMQGLNSRDEDGGDGGVGVNKATRNLGGREQAQELPRRGAVPSSEVAEAFSAAAPASAAQISSTTTTTLTTTGAAVVGVTTAVDVERLRRALAKVALKLNTSASSQAPSSASTALAAPLPASAPPLSSSSSSPGLNELAPPLPGSGLTPGQEGQALNEEAKSSLSKEKDGKKKKKKKKKKAGSKLGVGSSSDDSAVLPSSTLSAAPPQSASAKNTSSPPPPLVGSEDSGRCGEGQGKGSYEDLSRAGEMADAIDALHLVLHSLRSANAANARHNGGGGSSSSSSNGGGGGGGGGGGDASAESSGNDGGGLSGEQFDRLFTLRLREEFTCEACRDGVGVGEAGVVRVADSDVQSFSVNVPLLKRAHETLTAAAAARATPTAAATGATATATKNGMARSGGARGAARRSSAVATTNPTTSNALPSADAAAGGGVVRFDAVLAEASLGLCDVVSCKRTKQCASRATPLPCDRTLRRHPPPTPHSQASQPTPPPPPLPSSSASSVQGGGSNSDGSSDPILSPALCAATTPILPAVFTLELIQDSLRTRGDRDEIRRVLAMVQPRINLAAVFGGGGDVASRGGGVVPGEDAWTHHLRCFLCFHPHRHHYVVYCLDEHTGLWFALDDDKIAPVGGAYEDAAAAAAGSGFMPHVLFYEEPAGR